MKRTIILAVIMTVMPFMVAAASKDYEIVSPDATLKAEVKIEEGKIFWSVFKDGNMLLAPSEIAMQLADGSSYDGMVKFRKAVTANVDQMVDAPFYKKSKVRDNFNQLTLQFKTFDLVVRTYDAGAAYRLVSKSKVPFKVKGETAEFAFPQDWKMYVPYVCQNTQTLESQYFNSFENRYEHTSLSEWNRDRLAFLPLMVDASGYKINIMESALTNYPGMFLYNHDGDEVLETRFAPYPKEIKQGRSI